MAFSRCLRPVLGGIVLSASVGMWAAACGGSSNAPGSSGDGGSPDATAAPIDAGEDAGDDVVGDDGTVESGADATSDGAMEAGNDAGADADASDAADSADADASGDADADAAPQYCVGSGPVTVGVTCPPTSTTACAITDGGGDAGACGSTGSASYSSCTPAGCDGTESDIGYSVACYDGSSCTFGVGGIDFCAACGAGATCVFTDNGSAGSQAYYCGPGSDCTIHMNGSSGSRIVDCSQAKKCTVDGFVSGETQVNCPADCSVNVTGGFGTTCCSTPPVQCQNGSYQCSPAGAGDAGGEGGADGGC